jgi:hypothetical protein
VRHLHRLLGGLLLAMSPRGIARHHTAARYSGQVRRFCAACRAFLGRGAEDELGARVSRHRLLDLWEPDPAIFGPRESANCLIFVQHSRDQVERAVQRLKRINAGSGLSNDRWAGVVPRRAGRMDFLYRCTPARCA